MARPEIEPKTPLGKRLRAVRNILEIDDRDDLAKRLDISLGALAYYERGERIPDAAVLAAYRAVFGINVNWLVTGVGDMFDDPSKAPAPSVQVNPILMETLAKAIERVYRDMGERLPPHRVTLEAATMYNTLLSRVTDVRDKVIVDAVIPALAKELSEQLQRTAEMFGGNRTGG